MTSANLGIAFGYVPPLLAAALGLASVLRSAELAS